MNLLNDLVLSGRDGTIRLHLGVLVKGDESHTVAGAKARVESGSDLESRVTLTRLVAVGIFAFGMKKKSGGESFLTVEGPDFFWAVEVGPKEKSDAIRFAAAVNDASAKAAELGFSSDIPPATKLRAKVFGSMGGGQHELRLFDDRLEVVSGWVGVVQRVIPIGQVRSVELAEKVARVTLDGEVLEVQATKHAAAKFVEKANASLGSSGHEKLG